MSCVMEAMDQMAMENSVHWCVSLVCIIGVFMCWGWSDGHVLRKALWFDGEGQWRKGR